MADSGRARDRRADAQAVLLAGLHVTCRPWPACTSCAGPCDAAQAGASAEDQDAAGTLFRAQRVDRVVQLFPDDARHSPSSTRSRGARFPRAARIPRIA